MVTFDQYTYNRPNFEEDKQRFELLLKNFKNASSVEEQSEAIEKINAFRESFSTQNNLAYIRASIDTNDTFYQSERDYFDEVSPQLE